MWLRSTAADKICESQMGTQNNTIPRACHQPHQTLFPASTKHDSFSEQPHSSTWGKTVWEIICQAFNWNGQLVQIEKTKHLQNRFLIIYIIHTYHCTSDTHYKNTLRIDMKHTSARRNNTKDTQENHQPRVRTAGCLTNIQPKTCSALSKTVPLMEKSNFKLRLSPQLLMLGNTDEKLWEQTMKNHPHPELHGKCLGPQHYPIDTIFKLLLFTFGQRTLMWDTGLNNKIFPALPQSPATLGGWTWPFPSLLASGSFQP